MDICSAISQRILSLCYEAHWSLHKLAMESGISPSTIKSIVYGKSHNPGIVTIKIICDGLGISLVDFFNSREFDELEQEIR